MNQAQQLSKDICSGASASPDQIGDVMPNSISTTTLPVDESTKRISAQALAGYVSGLIQNGAVPGTKATFDEQMAADKKFYDAVQAEYCFYESRYIAALTQFLGLVADPRGSDATTTQNSLSSVIALNARLNSLLEILAFVGNERAQKVAARSPQIDEANASLDKKIAILRQQRETLGSKEGVQRTQEEMVRFSAEKSRAMNIQIMFFVALNVVALGTVLTVYTGSQ
jgi:hypothetical protein